MPKMAHRRSPLPRMFAPDPALFALLVFGVFGVNSAAMMAVVPVRHSLIPRMMVAQFPNLEWPVSAHPQIPGAVDFPSLVVD